MKQFSPCQNDSPERRERAFGPQRCKLTAGSNASNNECLDGYLEYPTNTPLISGNYWAYVLSEVPGSDCTGGVNYQKICARRTNTYPNTEADQIKCCIGERDPKECPPTYCINSENCYSLMSGKCSGNKFTNDDNCIDWCLKNQGDCDQGAVEYCTRTKGGSTPKGIAFCSCISAPSNSIKDMISIPQCFDAKCMGGGYETKQMKAIVAGGCPNVCQALQMCKQSGTTNICNIDQNKIGIQCGDDTKKPPVVTPVVTPVDTPVVTPVDTPVDTSADTDLSNLTKGSSEKGRTESEEKWKKISMIIIIVSLVLIAVSIAALLGVFANKANHQTSANIVQSETGKHIPEQQHSL